MSLVRFDSSIVKVKQSFIVSQIVSCPVVLSYFVLLDSVRCCSLIFLKKLYETIFRCSFSDIWNNPGLGKCYIYNTFPNIDYSGYLIQLLFNMQPGFVLTTVNARKKK